jgi:hypothetical protein
MYWLRQPAGVPSLHIVPGRCIVALVIDSDQVAKDPNHCEDGVASVL